MAKEKIIGNDDALFLKLQKEKKKKRIKIITTVVVITALIVTAGTIVAKYYKNKVDEGAKDMNLDVLSYTASRDTISTTVSGDGVLYAVGEEQISLPDGVELEEVVVEKGDKVEKGDALATLKMSSVMNAISAKQDEIESLDSEIDDADDDSVSKYIKSGVTGRVKKLYANKGDNVIDCMLENGALAVLSMDGSMALDIDAGLEVGKEVKVVSQEKDYTGKVISSANGKSCVTLTDDGTVFGEKAEVFDADGKSLGVSELYIHNPLMITGYAGTVDKVSVKENDKVKSGTTLFSLANTEYSANYDALLKSRKEKEEELSELIAMMTTGSITAPFSGIVQSIADEEESTSSTTSAGTGSIMDYYSMMGLGGFGVSASSATASSTKNSSDESDILTLVPTDEAYISIEVDETDILSIEVGQSAQVTISALDDEVFEGKVTKVNKIAESSSGITSYTAEITIDRTEKMLMGMSADVDIEIEGSENTVIIPVEALHKTSTSSFVYTEYNKQTGEYGGMKEVVTGISNSNYIEITSGLEEGEVIYYTETEEQFLMNAFSNMGGFGGRNGFSAKNMGGMGGNGRK